MIDLIAWLHKRRHQMYLDERAIQLVFDCDTEDIPNNLELQRELRSNDEERVAVIWLHGEQNELYAFHDADQIARAVNKARQPNAGVIPIKVDE